MLNVTSNPKFLYVHHCPGYCPSQGQEMTIEAPIDMFTGTIQVMPEPYCAYSLVALELVKVTPADWKIV